MKKGIRPSKTGWTKLVLHYIVLHKGHLKLSNLWANSYIFKIKRI